MAPEKKIVGRQSQTTSRLKQRAISGRLCRKITSFPSLAFMIDFLLFCRRCVEINPTFLRSADACSAYILDWRTTAKKNERGRRKD